MSITVQAVVIDLNAELKTSEDTSTISAAIKKAMTKAVKWLVKKDKWSCLHTSAPATALAEGSYTIDWPAYFRELDYITLNDGTHNGPPLTKLEGGFGEWLKYRDEATSANYGEPEEYTQRGKKFYLKPFANGAYTPTVWFWKIHPPIEVVSTEILFDDEFKESLVSATIAAYLDGKKQHSLAQYYWARAESELEDMDDFKDTKLRITKYRDL